MATDDAAPVAPGVPDAARGRSFLGSPTGIVFNLYAATAAFSAYFCMYAFRKPFTAAAFEGKLDVAWLPAIDWKVALILSQLFGYTLSKFIGIKVVSEASPAKRAVAIVGLILAAEVALVLFAVTPAPWSAVFLFLNGLPLAMVWGLVFAFLEGRRTTEFLGAALSVSFIVSSGAVKSVGSVLLGWGVAETAMPALVGILFVPLLLGSVAMLARVPPPTPEDEAARVHRQPMHRDDRRRFLRAYAPGLVLLVVFYTVLTALRDFRDNFAAEIWKELGYASNPAIFALSELPIGLVVLVAVAAMMLVKDNRRAVLALHGLVAIGAATIGIATAAFQVGLIGDVAWMIAVGTGLYVAYVPFGAILFDRLLAATGFVGTAGFLIYVADAFGYLGSVAVYLVKSLAQPRASWMAFFIPFCYAASIGCTLGFAGALAYFARRTRPS